MDIIVNNKKLKKILEDKSKIRKEYGPKMADKIMQRIDDMKCAENLEVLMKLPGNHHPLTGDRKGQFACNLVQPYRLIYRPANDTLPIDDNDNLIYAEITIVEILEIVDYH
jgi:Plasmid maintenance system killer protein